MNIVLTGSSSGIGRALTLRLLQRGHAVWGIARSTQQDLVNRCGGQFFASRCDVSKWELVAQAAADVSNVWSHVDAVVTCAGLQGEVGRTLASDPHRWSDTVHANLDGTYYALRAFASALAKAPRRAKAVCFSGGGATKARPNFSAYGAAKTAIVRLVETIAAEEQGKPFDINAVAPGAINTRLTDEVLALGPSVVGADEFAAAQKQKAAGGSSMDRALDLVEWLLSACSDGITGRLISAPWDRWETLDSHISRLKSTDIYMLRRILPEERGQNFGPQT